MEPYVCRLDENIQAIARRELGEDARTREEALAQFRDWLKTKPHIVARTDHQTLLRYLRGCKFNVDKAQMKLEMYYACKTVMPKLLINRNPFLPEIQAVLRLGLMVPLPGYDAEGRKVILARLGAWDPKKHKPKDLLKAASMLLDVLFMDEEQISVTGFVQLHDLSGFSLKHASVLDVSLVKRVMTVWREAYPIRPKAVHYINTPAAFKPIFEVGKKFMKEKMKKRVFVHDTNMNALNKHIPASFLPKEYGGSKYSLAEVTEHWARRIEIYRKWFDEDEKYKMTDRKHALALKKVKDVVSASQSIKKLEID
ncbi:retinol-binding protein pinta [Hyalella azteca]|uniref:Retinol-binding protein pinta n=1 Tax=Hyalella azteca TaxID=294128 RepID=A0A8B7NZV6_HYAAZ|nr:retinol-binding protein pinta [Hyalella azteca]